MLHILQLVKEIIISPSRSRGHFPEITQVRNLIPGALAFFNISYQICTKALSVVIKVSRQIENIVDTIASGGMTVQPLIERLKTLKKIKPF